MFCRSFVTVQNTTLAFFAFGYFVVVFLNRILIAFFTLLCAFDVGQLYSLNSKDTTLVPQDVYTYPQLDSKDIINTVHIDHPITKVLDSEWFPLSVSTPGAVEEGGAQIPLHLATFRSDKACTEAFHHHASDATSRTGVFGHGNYQVTKC